MVKKKKKTFTILLTLILIVSFVINLAVAYFVDADTSKNTFVVGNVEIDLQETNWNPINGKDLYPNEIVSKNPLIINNGKNPCYVGMRVSGIKAFVENGYILGVQKDDGNGLKNSSDEVFCWNESFSLVRRDGQKIKSGNDNSLTLDELNQIIDENDVLYFAYNYIVEVNESTDPLFTHVQFKGSPEESAVRIIKYFTKENGSLYCPVEMGYFPDGDPAVNSNGEIIYKYKISVSGIEKNEIYDTYEDAKVTADIYRDDLDEDANLSIKSAAIQSTNDSIQDWGNSEKWYPQLSSEF